MNLRPRPATLSDSILAVIDVPKRTVVVFLLAGPGVVTLGTDGAASGGTVMGGTTDPFPLYCDIRDLTGDDEDITRLESLGIFFLKDKL